MANNTLTYLLTMDASQAKAALASFSTQLSGTVRSAAAGVGNPFSGLTSGVTRAQAAITGLSTSMLAMQAVAGSSLASFAVASFKAANSAELAFLGMQSAARATGDSFAQMWGMVQKYSKDGLVNEADASAAIRNLRAVGYSAEQIDMLMQKLIDRAAFNREAQYSTIGEAVKTFASALATGNSELSNSLLMEQNLSDVQKEYIASNGLLVSSLTDRQKAEAYLNWIMKETNANQGDANRLLDSGAGAAMKLETAYGKLKTAVGSELGGPLTKLIDNVLIPLTKALGLGAEAFGEFGSNMAAALKAAKEANSLEDLDKKMAPKLAASGDRLMKRTEETLLSMGMPPRVDAAPLKDYSSTRLQQGALVAANKKWLESYAKQQGISQEKILASVGMPPAGMPPLYQPVPGGKQITTVDGPTRSTRGTVDSGPDAEQLAKRKKAEQEKADREAAAGRMEQNKMAIDAAKSRASDELGILRSQLAASTALKDDARAREQITDSEYARQTSQNNMQLLEKEAANRVKLIELTQTALNDAIAAKDPKAEAEYRQQLETLKAQQREYQNSRAAENTKANTTIFEADKATAQKSRQEREKAFEDSLKTELELFSAKNDEELSALEALHDEKLISESEYLDKVAELNKAAIDMATSQAEQRITFYQDQRPLDKQDGQSLKAKIAEQETIIEANAAAVRKISNETASKQRQNAIELARLQAQLDADLMEAEGKTFEAKTARIDQWLAEKRQEFSQLPALAAKAEAIAAAQRKQAGFENVQEQISAVNSDYQRQQDALGRQNQARLITDIALEEQSLALKKKQAAALRERLDLLKQNSSGSAADKETIAGIEEQLAVLDGAFSEFGQSINDNLFNEVNAGFKEMFLSILNGGRSTMDILKGVIANTLGEVASMFLKNGLQGAFANMGMTQGGGLGGMVMSLFGGFRAAGGDTKAGQAYIVGEKGPELWFSGANGRVVSNADIQSALTGSRIASPVYSANQYSGAQSPTVHNNVSTKAFIATEQVIDALRDAPGFERFVTDLVVANGRKIQGRWG